MCGLRARGSGFIKYMGRAPPGAFSLVYRTKVALSAHGQACGEYYQLSPRQSKSLILSYLISYLEESWVSTTGGDKQPHSGFLVSR